VKNFFISEKHTPLHRSTVNLLLQKYSAAASSDRDVKPGLNSLNSSGISWRKVLDEGGARSPVRTGVDCTFLPFRSPVACQDVYHG
jgi:hypothetical protein